MSLARKVHRALIAVWEALVAWFYVVVVFCVALAVLFLVFFAFGMALELAERVAS